MSAPAFWEGLYASGADGWELGGPAPPLLGWLDAGGRFASADPARPPRVAVPGCGRGHDARHLARHGCQAWGFDFAEPAVTAARALAADAVDVTVERRDVFALAADYAGFFDAAWEYTCFCAIDPARRAEYAGVLSAILRPGGALLACFFPLREGGDGPPFPVSIAEVERVLGPGFDVVSAGPPAASAGPRRGLEWLVHARRRP